MKKQTSLLEFFQRSPLAELDLERDRSPIRPLPTSQKADGPPLAGERRLMIGDAVAASDD